jgi:hypothetical protein
MTTATTRQHAEREQHDMNDDGNCDCDHNRYDCDNNGDAIMGQQQKRQQHRQHR